MSAVRMGGGLLSAVGEGAENCLYREAGFPALLARLRWRTTQWGKGSCKARCAGAAWVRSHVPGQAASAVARHKGAQC